jgi:hypothetical protein
VPKRPIKQRALQAAEKLFSGCLKRQGTTSQAAEKLIPEGDGGFNPRVKPINSMRASAPEGGFSSILPDTRRCIRARLHRLLKNSFRKATGVSTLV